MAMKVDNSLTSSKILAKTSIATVVKNSAQAVVSLRSGAHGLFDNQRMQAIAEALGRGDVKETEINA